MGNRTDIIILACELKDFGSTVESLDPAQATETLRSYLARVAALAKEHNARVLLHSGDEFVLAWGVPGSGAPDVFDALGMCLSLREDLGKINSARMGQMKPPFRLRMGMHFAPATIAKIDALESQDFTIIGSIVAKSNELRKLADDAQVDLLVSDTVSEASRDFILEAFSAAGVHAFKLRGFLDEKGEKVLVQTPYSSNEEMEKTPPAGTPSLPAGEENFIDPELLNQASLPDHWFIRKDDQVLGPLSRDEIIASLTTMELLPSHFACQDMNDPKWAPIGSLPEFADICKRAA